jgi:antitoxin component of MazEF toxin-antitoxin module
MTTTVKLRKQTPKSASLVLTIPKTYVDAHGLKEGDYVEVLLNKVGKI